MPSRSSRRRFVQGTAALGAAAALGLPRRAGAAVQSGLGGPPVLRGNRFDLSLDRIAINKSGTTDWANAINGIVPGPVLNWREGDVVTINLTNNLPEMTGVHWHGIILPNPMDGVPGLEFPGIMPGETFTYRFPVVQSGTYWYHSHMGYQEQKGVYSALVIDPAGEPMIKADRDYVVVLSEWMDGSPLVVQNNLKRMSDYYNFNRRTVGTFFSDVEQSGLKATLKDRWQWADMRMDPSGIQEPTGPAFTYLMNGLPAHANWTALFRPGEQVRLRFINTSAQTFYDVSIPGLTMDVVHVHGNDVVPVPVDQFRIGVAETFDVIVQPQESRAYTIFAQNLTRSGYARGTLAPRAGMEAAIPPMDAAPIRTMADMGMAMMPGQVAASNPDRTRIDGIMPSMHGVTEAEKARRVGYQEKLDLPPVTKALKPGVEQQYVLDHSFQRLDLPGDGLNHLTGQRRILTYADLRSVHPGVDKRPPTREITLTLTGNMSRFIWGFNGQKVTGAKVWARRCSRTKVGVGVPLYRSEFAFYFWFGKRYRSAAVPSLPGDLPRVRQKFSEVGPIDVTLGERFRLRFVNSTMMTHPIHLHGMWMELENGQGDHLPYLHTISVQPAANVSLLVTPIATGQWPLHCHLLYHFEAGMFRTLRVLPKVA